MPSGFRVDTDNWIREYEEAKQLAQEILQLIQDRNVQNSTGGPEASRKTATARRKIGTLGTVVERLLKAVDAPDSEPPLSEQERNRRRDLLYDLRNRREQMQAAIRRTPAQSDREMLMGGQQGPNAMPQDTEATAELDAAGLITLQRQMMRNQDDALEDMSKTVKSTKHIALAIGEEADLQTRLLDDLDDNVEVTQSRMKAATLRVKQIIKDTSHWKGGLCIFLLVITLVIVLVIGFKIARFFV